MRPNTLNKTLQFMLDCEARRSPDGRVKVYALPKGDGGGSFEVAGITDKYDHADAVRIRDMIRRKAPIADIDATIMACYNADTKAVATWTTNEAVEAWLRDAALNRGLGGAAKIVQMAVNVKVDGNVGPKTKAAIAQAAAEDVPALLKHLRTSNEAYERRIAPPVGARAKFWKGLVNRWDKRTAFALTLV